MANEESRPGRAPSSLELLNAKIDLMTLPLAQVAEELIPHLVECDNPDQIREALLQVGRAGFGLGVGEQYRNGNTYSMLQQVTREKQTGK